MEAGVRSTYFNVFADAGFNTLGSNVVASSAVLPKRTGTLACEPSKKIFEISLGITSPSITVKASKFVKYKGSFF